MPASHSAPLIKIVPPTAPVEHALPFLRTVKPWRAPRVDALGQEFKRIMEQQALDIVFQPIAAMQGGEIFGMEALMRPPQHSALCRPDLLLDVAQGHGRLVELEQMAALKAIQSFGRLGLPGVLFVNLSAATLTHFAQQRGTVLLRALVDAGLPPSRLMLELTEYERVTHPEALLAAFEVFAHQGIRLALDDFGDGRSSLRLWTQLKPQIVKIDKYFIRGVHQDSHKVDVIRTILTLAERLGAQVVAEGVEEAAELTVLRDLGCGYAQGFYLGYPLAAPPRSIDAAAQRILSSSKIAVLPNSPPRPDLAHTVARLIMKCPTVTPTTPNDEVRRVFSAHPEQHALAVVDNDYPVGLINRRTFMDQYAQPFFNELHGRRPCEGHMNRTPIRVEASVAIDSMVRMLAGEDQRYLFEGFIVTDSGRYAGLATGESLVRAVTEQRIEAARHANPLTLLPGNIPITEHIQRLISSGVTFTACYFDLNNFKPFNDAYGYWRGDEMITLAAKTILAQADPGADFVGHVGGDDFIVLFQSDDWAERTEHIVTTFNQGARSLFDAEDLAEEGFESEDRQGFKMVFPLTSIAVGAVRVSPGAYASPEDIASAAAAAKKIAKQTASGIHLQS